MKKEKDFYGSEFYEYINKNEEKKEELNPEAPQDIPSFKSKNLEKIEEVTELPPELDLKKIHDLEYLYDIFSEPYDSYKSLSFLKKTRDKLLKAGYIDNPAMNAYLFWTTVERRLHIIYQRTHKLLSMKAKDKTDQPEDLALLKDIQRISELVAKLSTAMDATLQRVEKTKEIVDLHRETMNQAEKYVKEHTGEFVLKCYSCGKLVNTQGLPHFAICTEKGPRKELIYYTWSPELWLLVQKGLIPMHLMAFILRTSLEGIKYTARQRGELNIPKINIEEEEKKLKELMTEFELENK